MAPLKETENDIVWMTVGRPGYAGAKARESAGLLDQRFGPGNWRIAYLWRGSVIDREAALPLYEEAYHQHLAGNPDVLDWLCSTASEVYDTAPSNVESGVDFSAQEGRAVHLQDIAIRRVLGRLGRRFEGDHLVQIRSRASEGYRLNPGKVPFHEPGSIVQPSLAAGQWWGAGSVEDFWQSNKVLQVRTTVPESVLKSFLLRNLEPLAPGQANVAVFGGSFNPVHLGHLRIAQDLLDLYGFTKVVFVPNGSNYRKQGLIDEKHRVRMLELAIQDEPRFELCRFELGRKDVVGTHETLEHLEALFTSGPPFQLQVIRGSDVVRRMLRWRSLPAIVKHRVLVIVRPGFDPWQEFGSDERFRLHHDRFAILARPYEDGLSSSLVRERIDQGHSIRYLVPEPVRHYISETGCYK